MPRKTIKRNIHDFTKQIHSTVRMDTRFANLDNHNEKHAKITKLVTCVDCRGFDNGCNEYIGKYHKTCSEFQWW